MKVKQIITQLNWRFMLVRLLVNAFVLALTITILPHMRFVNGSLLSLLFMALVLGFLNALIKPFVQALTMSFFFATYGLVIVVVNALILVILQWLFPDRLEFDKLIWLLVAGLVVGLLSSFLETLLGLTLPITESRSPAVRRQLERQAHMAGWTESRQETPSISEVAPDLELPEAVAGRTEEPLGALVTSQPAEPPPDPDMEKAPPEPQEEQTGSVPPVAGDLTPGGLDLENAPTAGSLAPEDEADEDPQPQGADPDSRAPLPDAASAAPVEDVPEAPTASAVPISPEEEERS